MSDKSRDDEILEELQWLGRLDLIRAYRAGRYDEVLEELKRIRRAQEKVLLEAQEMLARHYAWEAKRLVDERNTPDWYKKY